MNEMECQSLTHFHHVSSRQHCEYTVNQSVPGQLRTSPQRSSGNNKALAGTFSALAAFALVAILVVAYVTVKRRRNGAIHSTMSPKSIREADSTQLDADGQVLRSSMRAITGEVYSTANGNGSSSLSPNKMDGADNTDGGDSGGSADDDV